MNELYGVKISKPGFDVRTAAPKDLAFSSQYDTLKVLHTGSLSINLSGETLNNQTKTYTASYTHDLGYVPLVLPSAVAVLNLNEPSGSTATFNINDASQQAIPSGGYSPATAAETADIYATTSTIVLKITRYETAVTDVTFGAHQAIVYYTLFYLKVNETVDYT